MDDFTLGYTEKILIERNKWFDSVILGEIRKIAVENGIETRVYLHDKAIVNALKKQIPKKPYVPWDSITNEFVCPECQHILLYRQGFCEECGQKLQWEAQ